MPDVITEATTLKIEMDFVDGDTRTNNIKDPKQNITSSDIEDLNQFIRENNALIGDKYNAPFARIKKATRVAKTTVNYDLT